MGKHLEGKTVLVTGAARGLGWGIARAMGLAGAKVCITDINVGEMKRATSDIQSDNSAVMSLHLDVSDLMAFQATTEKVVKKWGRLDIVVHNAIYMPLVLFENLTGDDWWRQIHVGLGGLFNATKAAWDIMKTQGGGCSTDADGSKHRGCLNQEQPKQPPHRS